jgi:hypothetical protein
VTTFLSRERECDENNTGQANWSIIDQEVNYLFKFYTRSLLVSFLSFSNKKPLLLDMYLMVS